MSSVKLPEVVEKSLDDEFGMRSMDGLLAARRIALLAYKSGVDAGVRADRTAMKKAMQDHYWDSFEQQKSLVLAHVEFVLDFPEPPIVASVMEKP